MATAPLPGPPQPTPPQLDGSPPSLSWEGEKMFNIYIYDYCFKRGFRKTARELMLEAEISPDSNPPINARQGLLFEWWSVFWVLFTAKANGQGPEEAMLYTQHQANQLAQRQANQRNMQPSGQAPPGGQPPQPGMPHQHPPPINRAPNGVSSRPGMMGFPSNGPMPNGVGPPPGPMQAGGPSGFMPQANGIPQPGPPLPQGVSSGQGQSFQPMSGGPRPSIGGMPNQQPPPQQPPQQQRGPNPAGPFQSPNMASPQNPPGPPQHPQHAQPPMGQLGPSPHLPQRSGMLPPNQGMNPMNPQGQPTGAGAPPPTQYPQMGRSPSRAATPSQGQSGMMHPSPSMANRQPPGNMQMSQDSMNLQLMSLPQMTVAQISKELGIEARDIASLSLHDKSRILTTYRNKSMQPQPGNPGGGLLENATAGPSNPMMMQIQAQRNNPQRNQPLLQSQPRGGKRNSTSPGEEHETLPHNDSSPPSNKRIRRSPMEQPVVPPTMNYNPQPQNHPQPGQMMINPQGGPQGQGMMPMRAPGAGPMGMNVNGRDPAPPHPGQPPMGSGPMGLGGMGMGPGPGPGPGPQPPMAMQGMQHMGGAAGPGGMPPQMGPPGNGTLTPHMQNQQMQVREALRHSGMMPKGPQPGGLGNMNAGSPPSTDPSHFNLGGGPQLGQGPGPGPGFNQNRMGQKAMGPPPSPALNGPPKDQKPPLMPGGPPGPGNIKNPMQNPNMPVNHNSPRNPPLPGAPGPSGSAAQTPNMGVGSVNGVVQGPSTPVPNPANINPNPTPTPGPMGGPPPPPPPPPSSIGSLGDPGGSMGGLEGDLFSSDFIQTVAGSLDVFDPSFLPPTGDLNFERDFGQWFNNPDDTMSG